jgi:NAD-dependent dihydropyrimidine dehydrogenase PreA subunit
MTFVIGEPCIDIMDKSCIEECPVDCIYEGARKLYIHPTECIDCGACEPTCPVEAIAPETDVEADQERFVEDDARFFSEPLPGRDEALGAPGGAASVGAVGIDTELVAGQERRSES